ncbi:MAG: hypothetical protein U5J97_00855 [Trueperaceae bacterium]|nr:hypothetical protein [Trueperaceae bacterium]
MGKALLGRKPGEKVQVVTEDRSASYTIVAIE